MRSVTLAALTAALCVSYLLLGATSAMAAGPDPQGTIYVAVEGGSQGDAINVFAPGSSGNVAPERVIAGSNTGLNAPGDVKVDSAGDVYVANFSGNSITEYAPGASGNATPICTISGSNTQLSTPDDMSLEANGTLVVGNLYASSVVVFAPGACGNVTPVEELSGSNTTFNDVDGVGTDAAGTIFADNTEGQAIDIFPAGANGNVAPSGSISGSNTGLGAPNDVVVGFGGQLFVSAGSGFGPTNAVTVYAPGSTGNVSPIQDITGSNTDFGNPDDLAVDTSGNIYVTDGESSQGPAVLEFASGATGNVAPSAVLAGSNADLGYPEGVAVAGPPSTNSATMTTQAASPTTFPVGGSTHDVATLSGGTTPTGQIVWKLFGPSDPTCSATPAYVSPAQTVTGDGSYTSPSFAPTSAGTYSWVAEYSGDVNNAPITTACGAPSETVTVTSSVSGCTMNSTPTTTAFNSSGSSIHIENTLKSATPGSGQHLSLRSISGPSGYFALTSTGNFNAALTDATCRDNPLYPLGPGSSFNEFIGDGSGVYGTSPTTAHSGYTIRIEIGDYGDGGSTDNTAADSVIFTVKNSGGTVVWQGVGNLTAGSEEETG